MPTDSNGNHSLPDGYLAVTGETILPSQHNPPLEDIAAALTARVMRNGSAPMTGNLPMGGFKVTGLANGTQSGDAINKSQLDAVGGLFYRLVESVKTDTYSVVADDAKTMLIANKATALTFNLPAVAGVSGSAFPVRNIGVGDLTIDPNSAEQIEGASTLVLKQGDAAILWANGTTWRAFISRRKATQAEAEAGTATDVFMDPQRVRQATSAFVVPMIGMPMPRKLVATVTSDTAVTVTADEVVMSDGTSFKRFAGINVSAAITTAGANGLDTGSEASNTWYAFHLIYNPTTDTLAGLLSLSATAPTLPSGYTFARRLAWVRNNGSSNLYRTIQYGTHAAYVFGTNPSANIAIITGTSAGTNVSYADFIPPTASTILGVLSGQVVESDIIRCGPATAIDAAKIGPVNSGTSMTMAVPFTITTSNQTMRYAANGSTPRADVLGWIDQF